MCNLYGIKVSWQEYLDYFRASDAVRAEIFAEIEQRDVYPGGKGLTIRQTDAARVAEEMSWGFPTRKARKREPKEGQAPHVTEWWTNCRNLDSNMWRFQLARSEQRCLVPFTRFSEPKAREDRSDPKDLWWWFTVADQPIPCFAGIWKVDAVEGPVYSFLTTEPNALVGDKHQKAMPVILAAEDHDRWLTAPWDDAKELVSSYPSQLMAMA